MYELHMPTILLAQLGLQNGAISASTAESEFKRGLINLKLSTEHLKHEPKGTFEHNLYLEAMASVKPLQDFVQTAFPNKKKAS